MAGKAAGAEAVRVDAYETRPGSLQADCMQERRMLAEGSIHALAFTSTAEVGCILQQCPFPARFRPKLLLLGKLLLKLSSNSIWWQGSPPACQLYVLCM